MAKSNEKIPAEPKVDPVAKLIDRIIELQFGSLPRFAQEAKETSQQIEDLKSKLRAQEDNFTACNGRINELKNTAETIFELSEEELGKRLQMRARELQAQGGIKPTPPPEENASPEEEPEKDEEEK
jgi:beta-glucosidase-like glycosyl hydrolase